MGASRDAGVLEFCYRKISAVKQWKPLQGSQSKNLIFFRIPQSLYWRPSADQKARELWVRDCPRLDLVLGYQAVVFILFEVVLFWFEA